MFKALKIENSLTIKNLKLKILLFIFISLIFNLNSVPASASTFANAYVRLDSQQASVPLSGTVCAQASSAGAGIENSVIVTFPSDFTVSQTASNWTTSATNLPSGSTAWPVIGSPATSISGQSVTFSSSDLTLNTLYCFNFTGASSTTGALGDNKTGTITTKDNLNSTIDSTTYAISIVNSNQIGVTASIDPHVSDLPITFQSLTAGTQFQENTTISYQITYGSTGVSPIPLTIQAQWSQGTIQGSPAPSVDILNYVVGSATNAYNSTSPVIDTVNRTITWTITSIPGNTTNKTVNFSLKINSSYTGANLVSFTVSARSTSGTTTAPDVTVTKNYQYSAVSSATPTPTSAASATTTPTPTPTPSALAFKDISISSISQNNAKIAVSTNNKATFTLNYGTSINSLSQSVKTLISETDTVITLSGLETNTDYYFKITAKDANGITATSDIFIFKTANISEAPLVNLQSIVAVSNNVILLNPQAQITTGQISPKYIVVIPSSTVFEIHFALEKRVLVKSIQAIIKNKNVLGVNTFEQPEANSNFVQLAETQPGIYTGRLLSQPDPGNYELYVKVIDYNGNIALQKIADIRVVNKFKILEKGTKNPVEGARVLLYLYNPSAKIYEVISPQILPIDNPSLSNHDGTVNVVLPPGKYKAEVSAIVYNSSSSEFEINLNYGDYPTIYLEKQPFNILNTINYYTNTFSDTINASQDYVRARAESNRLFDLITVGALLVFVISTLFAFSAKTHIPVFYLPLFLIYKTNLLLKKNKSYVFLGKVVEDTTKNPVSKAIVSLIDSGNNTIATLKTNKLGEFYYPNVNLGDYKISVTKNGFKSSQLLAYKEENKIMPLTILIKKDESVLEKQIDIFLIYVIDFVGLLFGFMLAIGMIIEIFFVFTFGFLRIAPFMAITVLNLLLFFLFLYRPRNLESA